MNFSSFSFYSDENERLVQVLHTTEKKEKKGYLGFGCWEAVRIDLMAFHLNEKKIITDRCVIATGQLVHKTRRNHVDSKCLSVRYTWTTWYRRARLNRKIH